MRIFKLLLLLSSITLWAQPFSSRKNYSETDTLRGSNTEYRKGWDVRHYDLVIEPDFNTQSIKGINVIKFDVDESPVIQIDLQHPMAIDSIFTSDSISVPFIKKGNFYYLTLTGYFKNNTKNNELRIYFSGKPVVAKKAPWDGGWIFTRDENNNHWMTVACEGEGASIWFPCKDYLGDEPEEGATITICTDRNLKGVGNGKLIKTTEDKEKTYYTWQVVNPINNYNIIPYIGDYVNFSDTYIGEKGTLQLEYWVLPYNLDKAKDQFKQVKEMLQALEYWFGPYPFYEDGYKLVEAPHLGMEHQSAIAYGNGYINGYSGYDRSGTGVGLNWDFIIVHESGHEWFGNSISNADVADMWIHEAFATYSETLFVEYHYGKKAADEYIVGQRKNIQNDIPIIGLYGVHQEGSSDMYDKGANMLHTIRQIIDDDDKFRDILRGLNKEFYHQTVTTRQIENYISQKSGMDLSKIFDQYLRTPRIPTLIYYIDKGISYQWVNVIPDFTMEINTSIGKIKPTTQWKSAKITQGTCFSVDKNYYIDVRNINKTGDRCKSQR
ncbi:MAG: M1 family metallopeptidase [Flavobacteriaceae bacterium]|jgi:aminopeptidase N|nr:M1 family metallopeptidase [Flavobacteriaceae bacterium]